MPPRYGRDGQRPGRTGWGYPHEFPQTHSSDEKRTPKRVHCGLVQPHDFLRRPPSILTRQSGIDRRLEMFPGRRPFNGRPALLAARRTVRFPLVILVTRALSRPVVRESATLGDAPLHLRFELPAWCPESSPSSRALQTFDAPLARHRVSVTHAITANGSPPTAFGSRWRPFDRACGTRHPREDPPPPPGAASRPRSRATPRTASRHAARFRGPPWRSALPACGITAMDANAKSHPVAFRAMRPSAASANGHPCRRARRAAPASARTRRPRCGPSGTRAIRAFARATGAAAPARALHACGRR